MAPVVCLDSGYEFVPSSFTHLCDNTKPPLLLLCCSLFGGFVSMQVVFAVVGYIYKMLIVFNCLYCQMEHFSSKLKLSHKNVAGIQVVTSN
jgi:hypothetical protein